MQKWNVEEAIGYKPLTTFWEDFSIAERFGIDAIKDTAARAFEAWKDNYKFLTELIMVINHKSWAWNEINRELMSFYSDLYYEYDEKAYSYLEKTGNKEALTYYFKTLD